MSDARAVVPRLPTQPGVYRFRDERGRALYIGRATDLRRRVASYWGDLRDRWHLRRMVAKIASVEAVPCESVHEAAWLERNLLERAKPYWNRTRGGQEVPVYVRLDPTPGRPGLSIVHSGQKPGDFGPYLGGLKVRTAVSALDRVLPLAYAGDRLLGSARDMARARGIEAGSRDVLIGVISGVLRREPDAQEWVRGELARRRDTAAGELAFEFAAKLQSELEAIEWVIAPQRVTDDTHPDIDLHGWADGTLVSFEVRRGRVCRWTQRAAPVEPPAAASTPSRWQPFVTQAAQLAARLRWASASD